MIKLNIVLITYKQENYIRQTVESILMQKTNFTFNIVVADDYSPDSTLDIIKEYAKESTIEFQILNGTHNLGYTKNYQRAFASCNAEYIAIMEGDDYWTSPHHLQRHVDFLEAHPEFSMSFNRHIRFFEDENREEIFDWTSDKSYESITTQDMIFINRIGNLSCSVFRNNLVKKLNSSIFDTTFADWLLGMIMGQYGPLAYQQEVTSAYRIHNHGQWSRMDSKEQDMRILQVADEYNKILEYKYDADFQELKRRKSVNIYGDKSFRGRVKRMVPAPLIELYNKILR